MKTAAIQEQMITETRISLDTAAIEGAALRGEFGPERRLIALSRRYLELRAVNHPSAPAIRNAARAGDLDTAMELIFTALRV